jgi:hypothetical protein
MTTPDDNTPENKIPDGNTPDDNAQMTMDDNIWGVVI